MGFFAKLRVPKWQPLLCRPGDIIDLFRESVAEGAPIISLVVEYNGQQYDVGVSANYSRERGFFDIEFAFDKQRFSTLEDFSQNCRIGDLPFQQAGILKVLKDREGGDPRQYTLLKNREIPV